MSWLVGVIANQTIYASSNPTVVVQQAQAKGEARFLITNKNKKTSMIYYRKVGDALWNPVSLEYNETRLATFNGTAGVSISLECYAQAPAEKPSDLITITTQYYQPRITTKPTVEFVSVNTPGYAQFKITNNDFDNVEIFYSVNGGSSWVGGNYVSSGGKLEPMLQGTPNSTITLEAYAVAISDISDPSEIVSATGTYGDMYIANAPAISVLTGTPIEGQARFAIQNMDNSEGFLYYNVDNGSWNEAIVGIYSAIEITITGTPGTNYILKALYSTNGKYDSNITMYNGTYYIKPQATEPTITNVTTTVEGQARFTVKNNEATSGTIYYKHNGTLTWSSTSIGSGATITLNYTGVPGSSIIAEVYYATNGKRDSEIATANGIHYQLPPKTATPAIMAGPQYYNDMAGMMAIDVEFGNADALPVTIYYKRSTTSTWTNGGTVQPNNSIIATYLLTTSGIIVQAYAVATGKLDSDINQTTIN